MTPKPNPSAGSDAMFQITYQSGQGVLIAALAVIDLISLAAAARAFAGFFV